MNLMKFTILNNNETQNSVEEVKLLINIDHIVSVKPINITDTDKRVIKGYWIRLSNGKKYKAISVPNSISEKFNDISPSPEYLAEELSLH